MNTPTRRQVAECVPKVGQVWPAHMRRCRRITDIRMIGSQLYIEWEGVHYSGGGCIKLGSWRSWAHNAAYLDRVHMKNSHD